MVFHSNILHCTFFIFERKNDEISSTHNNNRYCQCFLSIAAPFENVFIADEGLDIGFKAD